MRVQPPLKWHGGKWFLAPRIVGLMPPHTHYVEPFAGGLSVLLAKEPEGVSEVVNDVDRWLVNFWETLRDPDLFAVFSRQIDAHPFCEDSWKDAENYVTTRDKYEINPVSAWSFKVHKAIAFYITCRQSLAGRMKSFAPLSRTRTRGGMNEQASAWLTVVEGLPAVHARLKRVVILNRDALDVIRQQDGPDTLFYCDPPYLHETRATTDDYVYEMTAEQHGALLGVLSDVRGRFLLSGYRSPLYDDAAKRGCWDRVDFDLPNNAAGGAFKRRMVECVWRNF